MTGETGAAGWFVRAGPERPRSTEAAGVTTDGGDQRGD
jgi:hypothetical protein